MAKYTVEWLDEKMTRARVIRETGWWRKRRDYAEVKDKYAGSGKSYEGTYWFYTTTQVQSFTVQNRLTQGVRVDGKCAFKAEVSFTPDQVAAIRANPKGAVKVLWAKSWAYLAPHGDPIAETDLSDSVRNDSSLRNAALAVY